MANLEAEQDLRALCEELERWRRVRSARRVPVPDAFLEEAARLFPLLGVTRVCREARLNSQRVRTAIGTSPEPTNALVAKQKSSISELEFAEVIPTGAARDPVPYDSSSMVQAEVVAPTGMRLCLQGNLSLKQLIHEFIAANAGGGS